VFGAVFGLPSISENCTLISVAENELAGIISSYDITKHTTIRNKRFFITFSVGVIFKKNYSNILLLKRLTLVTAIGFSEYGG